MLEYLGYLGLVLLVVAWIPQVVQLVKTKKTDGISLTFTILYVAASASLTAYAIYLGDIPFSVLNALATVMALVQLVYVLKYSKR